MLKKIIKSSLIYGIAPYIPRIFSIFLLPFLTSHLNSSDYGVIGTITAYSSAINVFATLGFLNLLYTSFYQYEKNYKLIWGRLYSILIIWTLIYILFQFVFFYFFIPKEANNNKLNIILLLSLSSLFSGTSLIGNAYYQLHIKPFPIAIRTVFSGLLMIVINYYLVIYLNAGYMGYFIAFSTSTFLINVSYLFPLLKLKILPIFKFKKTIIKNHLKITLPTIPHYYSPFLLNSSSRIIMDRNFLSINKIGEFNIAQQFSGIFESLLIAINQAITPICFEEIKKNNKIAIKKIIYNLFSISLFGSVLFSIWSKEIFHLLIKNNVLNKTYPIAVIMIMAQNSKAFYVVNANYYFFNNKTFDVLKISLVAGLIALLGYAIFIPKYGIFGAALVYFFSMMYMGFSGFFFNFYKKNCYIDFKIFYKILLIIILTFIILYIIEFNFISKAFITIIFLIILSIWYWRNKFSQIQMNIQND